MAKLPVGHFGQVSRGAQILVQARLCVVDIRIIRYLMSYHPETIRKLRERRLLHQVSRPSEYQQRVRIGNV